MTLKPASSERSWPDPAGFPFFYGWVIVALAGLCAFWGLGVVARSYTVILKPLTEDLGMPRTMGVLGITVGSVVASLASPLIGRLVDQRGARLPVAISATVTGFTLIALAFVQDAWWFLVLFGGVLGLARPSLQAVGAQTTVAKWFVRKRGRAVTYATLGMPLSAVVLIPVTNWMVTNFDWRTAWIVLGTGILLFLALPAAIFMRGQPEDVGLLPDGDPPAVERGGAGADGTSQARGGSEVSWEAGAAFRTPTFWLLSAGFAVIGLVPTMMNIHMFPHFTDQGLDPTAAAAATGSFGLYVVGSRLLFWGQVFDRLPMQQVLVLWSCLMTGAIVAMLLVNGPVLAFVAAGCYGIAMGATAPLGTLAWARYYGRASLGSITGLASMVGIVNDIAGPLMPSLVHDLTGSYQGAFTATAAACVVGVLLFALAGVPRPPLKAAVA